MTIIDFAKTIIPDLENKFELYTLIRENPGVLIGKKVIAITSGFSCGSEGGTNMTINSINSKSIHCIPNELSPEFLGQLGWSPDIDTVHLKLKLI